MPPLCNAWLEDEWALNEDAILTPTGTLEKILICPANSLIKAAKSISDISFKEPGASYREVREKVFTRL